MPRPSKRPRIIGPFFLVAILLSAGVFIWQNQRNVRALQSAPPPVVEHQVIDVPETESVPSPEMVVEHGEDLALTAAQSRRLEPLAKAYAAELKPLQDQVQTATQSFEAYQQGKAKSKQVPMAELQAQMGELSQLSTRMVFLRRQYWGQIAPILTEQQRVRANELWRQGLTPTKGQEHK